MIIRRELLQKIATGDVDLAFRRWRRPTVKSGGRLRTAIGTLAIEAVDEIDEAAIDDDAVRRAGYSTREDLLASLDSGPGGTLYRIRLRLAGPDPRVELRERSELDEAERAEPGAPARAPRRREPERSLDAHRLTPARRAARGARVRSGRFARTTNATSSSATCASSRSWG